MAIDGAVYTKQRAPWRLAYNTKTIPSPYKKAKTAAHSEAQNSETYDKNSYGDIHPTQVRLDEISRIQLGHPCRYIHPHIRMLLITN